MNFSLITVSRVHEDGKIDGYLVQHKMGTTLEGAIDWAKQTEKANSDKIDVAVIDHPGYLCGPLESFYRRTRLDTPRNPKSPS